LEPGTYGPEPYVYDSIGNLSSKNGAAYNYGPQSAACPDGALDKAHAAVSAGGKTFCYDRSGNMVRRTIGGTTYTLTYDAENHLVNMTGGGVNATFIYDGDGKRVKSTVTTTTATVTTTFVGNYVEWTGNVSSMARYYYAGTTRVAKRVGSGALTWLLGDHLGSASVAVTAPESRQLYTAWGEARFGNLPTNYRFTGQYEQPELGLYYYGARWYDPALGRFIQPDTDVPESQDGRGLDRYSYVANNPIVYNDPSGYCWGVASGITGIPSYSTTCQNLNTALAIVQNPEASLAQKAGAGAYIAAEGLAHAALVAGAGLLACVAIGPGCTKVFEDGDPTNEAVGLAKTAESVLYKLNTYLLDPNHPRGKDMATWYEKALGFTQKNMGELAKQLVFNPKTAYVTNVTQYGTKYNQVISVTGANGKVIDVVAAWIELADGTIKLVTTVPAK
jgi:RHS repeat-associated protein